MGPHSSKACGPEPSRSGKKGPPTYGVIDSQSTKTTGSSYDRGIYGNKKIKGRKRHIVVDTLGHLLHVKVHAANIHDTKDGCFVFEEAVCVYPSLLGVSADEGYRKTVVNFVRHVLRKTIEISPKIKAAWVILAKRWMVERTFGWLNGYRRLAKDFEKSARSE